MSLKKGLKCSRVEAAERGSHLLNVFGMGSPDTHKRV
jgi:hypothetical protein